ncbi:MAG TPA: hypothetical protein VFB20_03805 [Burkholderiales bacterium]|nr:hypothetical protein [Burkholderiales bacterium]
MTNPAEFLLTAALLGALVLCGGLYAVLYAAGRLRASPAFQRTGYACYCLQCAAAVAVAAVTALGFGWKVLVAASVIAYFWIPPLTWHYLESLHKPKEQGS